VPAAICWLRTPAGEWTSISHGLGTAFADEPRLRDRLASGRGPVAIGDLGAVLPGSRLVVAPSSFRWAYGVSIRDGSEATMVVVVLIDRAIRTVDHRTRVALGAVVRGLAALRRGWVDRPTESIGAPAGEPSGRTLLGPRARSRAAGAEVMRASEVAAFFSVTPRTVTNWAVTGKLPSFRTTGGHLRFLRSDVIRFRPPARRRRASTVDGTGAAAEAAPTSGVKPTRTAVRPPGPGTDLAVPTAGQTRSTPPASQHRRDGKDDGLMRSSEVAALFSVTTKTVALWAASGRLPHFRTTGGHLRFRRADLDRLGHSVRVSQACTGPETPHPGRQVDT
jgi:excisionase family DNA binding protein